MKTKILISLLTLGGLAAASLTWAQNDSGNTSKTSDTHSCCNNGGMMMSMMPRQETSSAETPDNVPAYYSAYQRLSEALVQDNLTDAQQSADKLANKAREADLPAVVDAAEKIARSDSLESARESFLALNREVVPLLKDQPGFHVMRCPMVDNGRWIQTGEQVRNPYIGSRMVQCGIRDEFQY